MSDPNSLRMGLAFLCFLAAPIVVLLFPAPEARPTALALAVVGLLACPREL